MIHPNYQIATDLYIHAARASVWERFCRVSGWPRWRADVTQAAWVRGQAWQEGAQFMVASPHAGSETFTIRMAVPDDTTVWENNAAGQGSVYSLHLVDQVGGCKVSLRCTFHGWGALLKRVTAGAERDRLQTVLIALKEAVERPETRR